MRPALAAQDIHIWSAWLDQPAWRRARLASVLQADEQARAARFHFARDRNHYIVARAVLRLLLGRYLAAEPGRLGFSYAANGKPRLGDPWTASRLQFNLAHSHGLALYAFALGRSVGIDVEQVRPLTDLDALADTVFSPRERGALRALPPGERLQRFFRLWTLKEAFVKATGDGLSQPLDEIEISVSPGEATAALSLLSDPGAATRWTLRELVAPPTFAAAVATESRANADAGLALSRFSGTLLMRRWSQPPRRVPHLGARARPGAGGLPPPPRPSSGQ